MIATLVPVKALDATKSRLLPHLGATRVRELVIAMLEDVLEALLALPELRPLAVVTPDEAVARAARAAGALALQLPSGGLDADLAAAAQRLALGPRDALLVVLGDVAGIRSEDVRRLCAALPATGIVLAPSRDGGTALLLRRPHSAIASAYGPDSAARHRAAALRAGLVCREVAAPSLALDLDEPEDIDAFLSAQGSGGRRTRACLEAARREGAR